MSDKMTVLVVEPLAKPYTKEIGTDYKAMQKEVGGTFQAVYPYEDMVALICHDEGKLIGLPPNRFLHDESGNAYDMICGTFLVVGLGEEDFVSLTPEQQEKFSNHFAKGWIVAIPKEPKTNHKGAKHHER
ncbi:DUF3846 domain-containing protein [Bengtsoniella intestinalis]|uniref:DUF3846 domain-containing protein n=1 Tax=Bengtsoniella intestinalis TaxID=3073143 RepID=UPI00391F58CD